MSAPRQQHVHAADLEVFLDFVNTLEFEDGEPKEGLPDTAAAVEFFAAHGLAHPEALATADRDDRQLRRLRQVRAAARSVWDALVEGRNADAAAIERINEALRHRPAIELTADSDGCIVGHRHVGDPWDEALARTLEPFVDAVAQDESDRFRICANDSCRWVFYDESRGGRRRWCDMSTCGNRAKAARHRARQKAGSTPAD